MALLALLVSGPWLIVERLEADANTDVERALARFEARGLHRSPPLAPPTPLDVACERFDKTITDAEGGALVEQQQALSSPEALRDFLSPPVGRAARDAAWATLRPRIATLVPSIDTAIASREMLSKNQTEAIDVLSADMAALAREGHAEEAWAHCERILRLIDLMPENYGNAWLVRSSLTDIRCMEAEKLLARIGISPARRESISRWLDRFEKRSLIGVSMRHDLDEYLAWDLEQVERATRGGMLEMLLDAKRVERLRGFLRYPRPLRELYFRQDRARLADLWSDLLDALATPAGARERIAELEARIDSLDAARAPLTVLTLGGHLDTYRRYAFEAPTRVRMLRMALALSALPEVPDKAPLALDDPFAPLTKLHWKKTGPRSGLLWSAGGDGKDDGGKKPDPERTEHWWDPGFDLVFELSLPK